MKSWQQQNRSQSVQPRLECSVVPAFTATGADSWNGSAAVTCDLYDWWIFRTGPQGDFHELAAKLHKADLSPT